MELTASARDFSQAFDDDESRLGVIAGQDLTVIVPCYNERSTIITVLHMVRENLPLAELIAVDDASTDGSTDLLLGVCSAIGVIVKFLPENFGKGRAVKEGLKLATRDWVVIQDADLEYEPRDLKKLLKMRGPIAVYGSRYKNCGGLKNFRLNYFGVKVLSVWEWLLYGQWLSDPHCCYKMIRRDVLQILDIRSDGFEMCAEINSKLFRLDVKVSEVQVEYSPRSHREGKKIRLQDFFRAGWIYLRFRYWNSGVREAIDRVR